MYFNFKENDFKRADALLNIKEYNISAAEFYNAYLTDEANHLSLEEISPFISKYGVSDGLFRSLANKMEIDISDKEFKKMDEMCHVSTFKELKEKEYITNPYFKLIKDVKFSEKEWFLNKQFYKPYEAFVYDEIIVDDKTFAETTPIGYFKDKFSFPALIEGEYIWMSLIPHEINTMKEAIDKAHGNVVVFGLGLGYYTYMISEKSSVNKITVIEKDPRIIKLFNEYLLPLFPNKKKIRIICDDAYKYLDRNKEIFDFAFIDIYHNVGDGFPLYIKFKKYERRMKSTTFMYWIEVSLLAMARRYLLTLYEEKVHLKFTEKDYLHAENEADKFINKLYKYLKDYEFNSYEEWHEFLKDNSLRKLLRNLD